MTPETPILFEGPITREQIGRLDPEVYSLAIGQSLDGRWRFGVWKKRRGPNGTVWHNMEWTCTAAWPTALECLQAANLLFPELEPLTAFDLGWRDALIPHLRTRQNPFPEGSPEWWQYEEGFQAGEDRGPGVFRGD